MAVRDSTLDGRVAIVTGAGRGLGRVEALELAAQGARVVVNDVGAGLRGGRVANTADDVVDEIRGAGRDAVVHHGDVADFEAARDLIDAAAGYGRIVNTSSEAFLNGAVGQPNYAAAKAGIVQLTLNAAHALGRYGVTANAICPRARTRMTEHREVFHTVARNVDVFAPENVSPLVAWLASPAAAGVTGQVFVVYEQMITLLAPPSVEERFSSDRAWTPTGVGEHLEPFFAARNPADNFGVSLDVVMP